MEAAKGAEFIPHLFYIIAEIRIILHQMQISSQADPLYRLTQKRPSHAVPVLFRLQRGISALHKGRRAAKPHREQIRMQAKLMGIHLNPRAQPCFIA